MIHKREGVLTVKDPFIKAYHDFRNSVDLSRGGFLPDIENVVWYLIVGIPRVPADDDPSDSFQTETIDQRVAILKAVFVEANREEPKDFLDQGMRRYDLAGAMAKNLLLDSMAKTGSK